MATPRDRSTAARAARAAKVNNRCCGHELRSLVAAGASAAGRAGPTVMRMTTMVRPRVDVAAARDLAESLLTDLPQRWAHTAGVARRAAELCAAMPAADRNRVVTAAWLHDIGYAEPV